MEPGGKRIKTRRKPEHSQIGANYQEVVGPVGLVYLRNLVLMSY